ncbi:MAG: branched-chain amino acid ABC transporter permease, partial [Actinomycetota bacterium]
IETQEDRFRPPQGGWIARLVVGGFFLAALLTLIGVVSPLDANRIGYAFVFAIVGLSMRVLLGLLGQISLGHQAFVGIGAFMSGFVVTELGLDFTIAVPAAALSGAAAALILGAASLRIGGLLLALVTLTYGAVAERTIFLLRQFTGGGSGLPAPRPTWSMSDTTYAYVCLGFLALVLFIDWRFVKTKAGRAVQAVRDSERVAASMGISVLKYKLLAFVLSGFLAGLAGGLLAHNIGTVQAAPFNFFLALEFVLMTVVGGLQYRSGVVVGSMFFALLDRYFGNIYDWFLRQLDKVPGIRGVSDFLRDAIADPGLLVPAVGAGLLILTLIQFPGGIGQQLRPIMNWFAGGRLDMSLIHGAPTAQSGGQDVRP